MLSTLSPIHWRPATEVLAEEEDQEQQFNEQLHQDTIYVYSPQLKHSPPTLDVKEFCPEEWASHQHQRRMAPVGTRSLLRRRLHGNIVQDTLMIRESTKWACIHLFYTKEEQHLFQALPRY